MPAKSSPSGFGPLLGGSLLVASIKDMTIAAVLLAGETITIEASGEINIATDSADGIFATPDGLDFAGNTRPSPFLYFPLEEAAVDAGELTVPIPPSVDLVSIGALIGAFVPQAKVLTSDFVAQNNDPDPDIDHFDQLIPRDSPVGSIAASRLFLVGSGPYSFTAKKNGALFLGVNDANVLNNAGEFLVSTKLE